MTGETDDTDTITLTVEIDPAAFDEPRQVMWRKLVAQYGRRPVAELLGANLGQHLTGQTMQLLTALWDNRHQIDVPAEGGDPTLADDAEIDPSTLTDDGGRSDE